MSPLQGTQCLQFAHIALPAEAGTSVTSGGRGMTVVVGGGEQGRSCPRLCCADGRKEGFASMASGIWDTCKSHLWWKVGPIPAIMEFTKPEKNKALKMQREKEKVERGGIKSLGNLFCECF